MAFYEEQIQIFARRIKKIEESPDPIFLRCNKQLYELEKELVEEQRDGWQQGKPFAEGPGYDRLFRSMQCIPAGYTWSADHSTGYAGYKTTLERLGFPEKCCDRTVAMFAMCEMGDVPKPSLTLSTSQACDAARLVFETMSGWFNTPVFHVDVSLDPENQLNLDSLNYLADQLGEFTEWAEKKVPGVKYDEDRLRELLEIDEIGLKYFREIYELRKHVPCPIAPLDGFRIIREPSHYPNQQKAIEYLRIYRDELGERVASGKGPYPEERSRLLWAVSGPFASSNLNPWRLLMERRVAMPLLMEGNNISMLVMRYLPHGEISEYGVMLSPLQDEARYADRSSFGGPGKRWVTDALDTARDIGAHGIVHYLQVGCTPVRSTNSVLAERAEKELGIPTLDLEGRQMDPDYMTQERLEETLSAFIDKCFDWAGKPRQ